MDPHNHSAMITNGQTLINTTTVHVHNHPTTLNHDNHVTTIMDHSVHGMSTMDHSGHGMSTMDQSSGGMNHMMMMSVRIEKKNEKKKIFIIFLIFDQMYFHGYQKDEIILVECWKTNSVGCE